MGDSGVQIGAEALLVLDKKANHGANAEEANGGSPMELDIAEDTPMPENINGGQPESSNGQGTGAHQTAEARVQSTEHSQPEALPFQPKKRLPQRWDTPEDGSLDLAEEPDLRKAQELSRTLQKVTVGRGTQRFNSDSPDKRMFGPSMQKWESGNPGNYLVKREVQPRSQSPAVEGVRPASGGPSWSSAGPDDEFGERIIEAQSARKIPHIGYSPITMDDLETIASLNRELISLNQRIEFFDLTTASFDHSIGLSGASISPSRLGAALRSVGLGSPSSDGLSTSSSQPIVRKRDPPHLANSQTQSTSLPNLQHVDLNRDNDLTLAIQPLTEESRSNAGASPMFDTTAHLSNAVDSFQAPADDSSHQRSPGLHPGDRMALWKNRSGQVCVCYADCDGNFWDESGTQLSQAEE